MAFTDISSTAASTSGYAGYYTDSRTVRTPSLISGPTHPGLTNRANTHKTHSDFSENQYYSTFFSTHHNQNNTSSLYEKITNLYPTRQPSSLPPSSKNRESRQESEYLTASEAQTDLSSKQFFYSRHSTIRPDLQFTQKSWFHQMEVANKFLPSYHPFRAGMCHAISEKWLRDSTNYPNEPGSAQQKRLFCEDGSFSEIYRATTASEYTDKTAHQLYGRSHISGLTAVGPTMQHKGNNPISSAMDQICQPGNYRITNIRSGNTHSIASRSDGKSIYIFDPNNGIYQPKSRLNAENLLSDIFNTSKKGVDLILIQEMEGNT